MKFRLLFALTLLAFAAACGAAMTPTTPTPVPATPAPSASIDLTGSWTGTSTDSQGLTVVNWTIAQSGATVTGTVTTHAPDPTDGSCNACHRNKSGTFTGTISAGTLTMTLAFAAGADGDPTPICSATMSGSAAALTGELSGTYAGSDTCEGAFLNGRIAMARR